MPDMFVPRANAFSQSPLDRLDARRRDSAWVDAACRDPASRFVPVWRGRNLIRRSDGQGPQVVYLPAGEMAEWLPRVPWALLGSRGEENLLCIDLSAYDQPLCETESTSFEDLRRMGGLLPAEEAAILAHARGLMHWRTRNRFCGICGGACTARDAGHVMQCHGCGAHHFPRTDPAVIMLVVHEDRVLLGQPARFRDMRVFTTLAGFVEPGETLEEAVAREVMEETGVGVTQVRYHSSQPWPFPSSIMLGFTAVATTQAITVDPEEIVEARWFRREDLVNPRGFVLPPDISIARRLIQDWIEGRLP